MENLGEIVRFHRKKSGLSQLELARLSGVGKSTVWDIEKGKTAVQMDKVLKVLGILNIAAELRSPLMEAYEKSEGLSE